MVDLGFLLITFFIFTSSLSEQKGLNIVMPAKEPPSTMAESKIITVILGEQDRIYYYHGMLQKSSALLHTNYSVEKGFGKVLRTKQQELGKVKSELMVLIKPSQNATYNNVINLLDEMAINQVKKYAIVNLSVEEQAFLDR